MCSLVRAIAHLGGSDKRARSSGGMMIRRGELKTL
jgi:hypothetical protein